MPATGSIFVLTNEEPIIQKMVGTLKEAGYSVPSATSAQTAMALLEAIRSLLRGLKLRCATTWTLNRDLSLRKRFALA
jgi:CheY-like chemotaxis protein